MYKCLLTLCYNNINNNGYLEPSIEPIIYLFFGRNIWYLRREIGVKQPLGLLYVAYGVHRRSI